MSEGFYVRRNYGKEIEVGVTKREMKWSGSFFLIENAEAHILLSWSEVRRLKVYPAKNELPKEFIV